ncbi:unnamed protein product [Anisakis simplex]|uniref:SIS domain-containing protein n=1 Tax=Anisakis simplex TaxID=6269 RepID=A0A0M3K2J3_ANISI|nr:unnamed protein product [Anisakis simplex]
MYENAFIEKHQIELLTLNINRKDFAHAISCIAGDLHSNDASPLVRRALHASAHPVLFLTVAVGSAM